MPSQSASKHKSTKGAAPKSKKMPPKVAKSPGKSAAKPEASEAAKGTKPSRAQRDSRISAHTSPHTSGDSICREVACEGLATSGGYCRLHYIKNWKKIKRKELILKEGKLNQYIEELVAKYPDKYIEAIRQDLANDREFGKVVHDLELDEGFDEFENEGENVDSLIDSIKRDIDDDEEVY